LVSSDSESLLTYRSPSSNEIFVTSYFAGGLAIRVRLDAQFS